MNNEHILLEYLKSCQTNFTINFSTKSTKKNTHEIGTTEIIIELILPSFFVKDRFHSINAI